MDSFNKQYLPMLENLKEHFQTNGQISLQEFLTTEALKTLSKTTEQTLVVDELTSHKYLELSNKKAISEILNEELLLSFIKELTDLKQKPEWSGKIFSKSDFSLRKQLEPGIKLMYVLKNSVPKASGGDVCFSQPEDTAILPPTGNTLTLIHVDQETDEFITYLTHYAENNKIIFFEALLQ